MKIGYLKLLNFRNYSNLEIRFTDKFNIIYGNNGMGKTNLVEAIYVLALTKSFRNIQDKGLIKKDKDLTKIEGIIDDDNYKVILSNEGKRVKINNNKIPKVSDYISKINIVKFSPDDLRIIKDAPSIRRKMLNIGISQIDNVYLKHLANYNNLLKQRNAYLKRLFINGNSSSDYLNILTDQLITEGMYLLKKRNDYILEINKYLNNYYKDISKEGVLTVNYVSDFSNKKVEELQKEYRKLLNKEMAFGKTIIGVHHDDLEFYLDGEPIREWGSEGQQKNAIIALKLSEIELIKKIKKVEPILILDDLFSELDSEKINRIMKIIRDKIQTFITTTNIDLIDDEIKKNSKIIKVIEGCVEEE